MSDANINTPNNPSTNPIDRPSQYQKGFFPFSEFSADDPNVTANPTLTLSKAWRFIAQTAYVDTAANIASANPVLFKGQIGYETDTLSFKIGDGSTAYNSLTYSYRGLLVAGEPSLGTEHFKKRDGTDRTVIAAQAGSAAWTAVDCSSLVSVGAKAVKIHILAQAAGAAAGVETVLVYCFSNENSSSPGTATSYPSIVLQFPGISGVGGAFSQDKDIVVPLDSSRKFYYYRTINTSTASPTLTAYVVAEYL
jgi:hypothetical protein